MDQQEHEDGHQLRNINDGTIRTSRRSLDEEQQEVWTKESQTPSKTKKNNISWGALVTFKLGEDAQE